MSLPSATIARTLFEEKSNVDSFPLFRRLGFELPKKISGRSLRITPTGPNPLHNGAPPDQHKFDSHHQRN